MVWSLEAGFEGAYEADCDMVDPKKRNKSSILHNIPDLVLHVFNQSRATTIPRLEYLILKNP